jgi:hypothetical protein
MFDEGQKKGQGSEPREVRVNRLSRTPGPKKAIISLGLVILLIVVFVLVFLMRGV